MPRPRIEHIPDQGLTRREKEAFDFFEAASIPASKGVKRIPVPHIWLPHVSYVFSNPALSTLGFCSAEPHGGSILLLLGRYDPCLFLHYYLLTV